jgi:hypothetical protein
MKYSRTSGKGKADENHVKIAMSGNVFSLLRKTSTVSVKLGYLAAITSVLRSLSAKCKAKPPPAPIGG